MKAFDKGMKYFRDGKVFPLTNAETVEIWGVEGATGVHEVRYDKQKQVYACNCKNIRNTKCSHIEAVFIKHMEKMTDPYKNLFNGIGRL